MFQRPIGEQVEFLIVSFWDSADSIRAFAGEDMEQARYYSEDDAYLLDKPAHVTHYEVAHSE